MKRISCSTIVFAMICIFFATNLLAQSTRILGGHVLQLDDGNGNTISIQTPGSGWSGNIDYMLPQPPYPFGASGWIAAGTLAGQIPVWDVLLNSWQPKLPSALPVASNAEPFITFAPAIGLTNNQILNAGTGIDLVSSGIVPNASLTVNNTGVLSNIAGQGISLSGATGNVTITNTGVVQILGTPNQVVANNIGAIGQGGVFVLSTPQDIAPTSAPTFAGLTITGLTPAGIVHNNVNGLLSSSAVDLASADIINTLPLSNGGTGISAVPDNGQLMIGNGAGYSLATITGTLDEINVANAAGSITLSTPQPIAATSSPTFSALSLTGKGTSASTGAEDVGTTLLTKDFVTTAGNVSVITNSSFIGDGTTLNPLGINLNNSNTYTADQLLQNSTAQGDNLISAVNAGSTTINASVIGNGITDAQVNDNLTIDGGTVDNSPIGANVRNAGNFTTLDANNGLTVSNNTELTLTGGVNNKFASDPLAVPYSLGSQDYILVCTNEIDGDVNLPVNPPAGRTYIIKSIGGGNINVVPANAFIAIDGVTGNYVINGGLKKYIIIVSDGTDWFIVTK